ncbi:MAG: class I SAM-dependent methyltransferase, partial [Pseudomonadota bacterium]|nr:class I SAM-dependent methyltransferase [Pseudomonadota bacterium]
DMLKALNYETYDRIPRSLAAQALECGYFLGRGRRFARLAARLGLHRQSALQRQWRQESAAMKNIRAPAQAQAFGSLVQQGVYDAAFRHSQPARNFFRDTVRQALGAMPESRSLAILECGCGTGAWLDCLRNEVLHDSGSRHRYYGFDLTPEMVEVARGKLAGQVPADHLRAGDVLDPASFAFPTDQRFDLIYAYDLIQQLPRSLQLAACRMLRDHLAPGGVVVIFDHDHFSRYGQKMAWKKFATRHLRLPLVPEYFCNAKYPPLAWFLSRLRKTANTRAEIRMAGDGRKRALIVRATDQFPQQTMHPPRAIAG